MGRTPPLRRPLNGFALRGAGACSTLALSNLTRPSASGRETPIPPLDDTTASPLVAAYIEHRSALVRYFRVRLRSEEAAEDLVQELYLKLEAAAHSEVLNATAYLYRVGTNLMLDRLKQQRRAMNRDGQWRASEVTALGDEDISQDRPADEALAARQRLAAIAEVVNDMPPQVREAFRLHKVEGLTHSETAARMGMSRSSVEKYIMTGLKLIMSKVGR